MTSQGPVGSTPIDSTPVGMVGTGNMGGRMTRRMVQAGYRVLAVDADPSRIPACDATPAKDLTGRLMAKDVRLYLDLAENLGAVTLTGPGTLTAFQVSNALGYADQISNRVVDALGDLSGGVRVAPDKDAEEG